MPNDALNYFFIATELNEILSGSRIEKIYMPTAGEIVLKCRNKSTYFLLISALASKPGIHLTTSGVENPLTPPSFLMHLRKHISNGIIIGVSAQQYERVIFIDILCRSEFVETKRRIVVEITGTYSNIILLDENNIISEAVKHITPDISPKRLVLPGLAYTPIPPQDKLLPNDRKLIDLLSNFEGDRPDKYILSLMSGMAPATISECVYRALGSIRKIKSQCEAEAIFDALNNIYITKNPCLIKRDGKYLDFYPSPFLSAVGEIEYHPTLNECMDIFYSNKNEGGGEISAQSKRLLNVLKNAEKRTRKKLEEFNIRKSECMDCENDRVKGELITANIYKIKKGETATYVYNYYTDENIEISLDKDKSPSENAQAFFKRYTKKKNTLFALEKQIDDAQKLLTKYENAMNSFELCTTKADLDDIETELYQLKLLQNKEIKNRKKTSEYLSVAINGYKIDIGKNNIQNERLYKSALNNDIWLHVLGAHGSHVIIHCGEKEAPNEVITSAAQLAAYYSKSKMADKVAVDYTYVKNVKPINGSGPGRVNYTNQKTLYVTPKSIIDFK